MIYGKIVFEQRALWICDIVICDLLRNIAISQCRNIALSQNETIAILQIAQKRKLKIAQKRTSQISQKWKIANSAKSICLTFLFSTLCDLRPICYCIGFLGSRYRNIAKLQFERFSFTKDIYHLQWMRYFAQRKILL